MVTLPLVTATADVTALFFRLEPGSKATSADEALMIASALSDCALIAALAARAAPRSAVMYSNGTLQPSAMMAAR